MKKRRGNVLLSSRKKKKILQWKVVLIFLWGRRKSTFPLVYGNNFVSIIVVGKISCSISRWMSKLLKRRRQQVLLPVPHWMNFLFFFWDKRITLDVSSISYENNLALLLKEGYTNCSISWYTIFLGEGGGIWFLFWVRSMSFLFSRKKKKITSFCLLWIKENLFLLTWGMGT